MIRFEKDGSYSMTYCELTPPEIQWNHIDGPLLHLCDGQLHWLTWMERIKLRLGLITVNDLDPVWMDYLRMKS